MRPLGDNVLIEVEDETNQTDGGIYVTRSLETGGAWAKVLAIGEDVFDISEGDEVYCMRGTGHLVKDRQVIVPQSAIIAKRE